MGRKLITTADRFLLHEGMLVWNSHLEVVKVTWVRADVYVYFIDSEQNVSLDAGSTLRVYHPETGVKASDHSHDAEEVLT